MKKGTTSRRGRTRPETPRTIDLAASEVKPAPDKPAAAAKSAPKTAAESTTSGGTDKIPAPSPEPVASTEMAAKGESKAEPAKSLSGFGATQSVKLAEATKPEKSTAPSDTQAASSKPVASETKSGNWGRGDGKAGTGSATKEPAASPARGGMAGMLLSGLIGALIALFLLGGLNTAGLLGQIPLLGGLAPAVHQVPDLTADVAALDKRIAALESEMHTASQGQDVSELSTNLDSLSARLSKVEETLNEMPGTAPEEGEIVNLSARLDALSQTVGQLEATPGKASDDAAVTSLRGEMDSLSASVQAAGAIADKSAARIENLEKTTADLANRLAALSATSEQQADKSSAARDVAVTALRAAYRRGEPFGDYVDSLETLAGPSPAIDALKPYAATGVATNAELLEGFKTASRRVLDALAPKDEGVVSRLLTNARSLIDVRPAGPVEGDTPRAILSRVEADLGDGALAKALAEWQSLPEQARQAASGWGGKLENRVAADQALHEVTAGLVPASQ
ncbi:MAG: hypothetical protein LJE67_00900 [Salaquimonas sp.]|nr:hypothetical protein [Salaquimonas sp.]